MNPVEDVNARTLILHSNNAKKLLTSCNEKKMLKKIRAFSLYMN